MTLRRPEANSFFSAAFSLRSRSSSAFKSSLDMAHQLLPIEDMEVHALSIGFASSLTPAWAVTTDVRFGSSADIGARPINVRLTPRERTSELSLGMSALSQKRTSVRVGLCPSVSKRPKRFLEVIAPQPALT
jgi:hypothetical protein